MVSLYQIFWNCKINFLWPGALKATLCIEGSPEISDFWLGDCLNLQPYNNPLRQTLGLTPPLARRKLKGGSAEPPQHIQCIIHSCSGQESFIDYQQVSIFNQIGFIAFIQFSILRFWAFGCIIKVQKRSESNVLTSFPDYRKRGYPMIDPIHYMK